MNRENEFSYKGFHLIFCGFHEDKFAFYCAGKCVFVADIDALEDVLVAAGATRFTS